MWAWRAGRVSQIKQLVDRMLVIFPFEEAIYRKAGVNAEFVGHPLIDMVKPTRTKDEFCREYRARSAQADRGLCFREAERKKCGFILPTLCKAVDRLPRKSSDVQFVLPLAFRPDRQLIDGMISSKPITRMTNDNLQRRSLRPRGHGSQRHGNARETALLGTPEVIVYRHFGSNLVSWQVLVEGSPVRHRQHHPWTKRWFRNSSRISSRRSRSAR